MASFTVLVERDEEGWLVGSVPELPGCLTQARAMDELLTNIREAIQLYLEVKGRPQESSRFVGLQVVEVEA